VPFWERLGGAAVAAERHDELAADPSGKFRSFVVLRAESERAVLTAASRREIGAALERRIVARV
jgi:hypothetical protein